MGNLDNIYTDPTLEAVHRVQEAEFNASPPRGYLGASSLGHQCERMLYYSYNGARSEPTKYHGVYAIEDGHRSEDLIAARLRKVENVTLYTHDSEGKQFGFSDMDGKFRGHIDGVITGLLQAPKTPHVWENKAVNEKKYGEFLKARDKFGEKAALQNWDYVYYIQALLYMHYMMLDRHYLTVCTPGGRDIASCRTDAVPVHAEAMKKKAKRIIEATSEPVRIMDDPTYYVCKWCRFRGVCYGEGN